MPKELRLIYRGTKHSHIDQGLPKATIKGIIDTVAESDNSFIVTALADTADLEAEFGSKLEKLVND
jgi:predicted nuclease of predicted toxin-antitoxin system